MNTLLSTGTLPSIVSTRKIWGQTPHHASAAHQHTQFFFLHFVCSCWWRSIQSLPSQKSSATIICVAESTSSRLLVSTLSSIFIGDMHVLLILQVSNNKIAHILGGNNISTQSRRPDSLDGHLHVRLQTVTGSASTSLASPTCRMDSDRALRTRSSRCCRIASCSQLVIHSKKSSTVLSGLRKASRSRRAVSRTYPTQLNCIDSRPRTRWCQLRGLLVGSDCICPQGNSYFVNTRGSGKPSAFRLPIHLSSAQ